MERKQIEDILSAYRTPLYIFDINELGERIKYIRKNLLSDVSLCYAIKANTFILKEICGLVDKFEVCSPGEVNICLKQNIPAEKLVISGVYKTPDVMERLIEADHPVNCYTAESFGQFELLRSLAERNQHKIRLLLRLTCGNQFGMNEDEIRKIVSVHANDPYISIAGIQYFSGTQKNSLKRLKREIEYLDGFMSDLAEKYGFYVSELEFGPGFPVSYFQSDDFDEQAFFEGFSEILLSMNYKTKITLELGRSIAASCGKYLTSVVDIKANNGQNYAITDGGMHQLVYFGQFMAMKKPYLELFPDRATGEYKDWNIFGSLCTVNDILVKQLSVRDLQIGDTVMFQNTGAYCCTEGISLFLSRDLPRILLLNTDGSVTSVREPIDTYQLNTPNEERKEK